MNEIDSFIELTLGASADKWASAQMSLMAAVSIPDSILGRRRSLLRGDITLQWARWFVESVADPRRVIKGMNYGCLFAEVLGALERLLTDSVTRTEKHALARTVARAVFAIAERMRSDTARVTLAFDERKWLVDLAGTPARCWICGAEFMEQAIEGFLAGQKIDCLPLPAFVDVLKPRGLIQRDLRIEVDHVIPVIHGGMNEGNLKLACGWCNLHKGSFQALYDINSQPLVAGKNKIGVNSLPQRFWTIRLLGLIGRCEHGEGCGKTSKDSALSVVAINSLGTLNPTNLRVTCYEHDTMEDSRLQPPSVIRQIWSVA